MFIRFSNHNHQMKYLNETKEKYSKYLFKKNSGELL